MKSRRLARRLAVTAGMGAIIAMGTLTACGQGEEAPETTTPTTTTTTVTTTAPPPPPPAPAPTEKSINPTGGNLFTPPVKAPPAPTAPPGDN
jgi:ABC-type glycerol-3-phosphate transport system substrate-binding protein